MNVLPEQSFKHRSECPARRLLLWLLKSSSLMSNAHNEAVTFEESAELSFPFLAYHINTAAMLAYRTKRLLKLTDNMSTFDFNTELLPLEAAPWLIDLPCSPCFLIRSWRLWYTGTIQFDRVI